MTNGSAASEVQPDYSHRYHAGNVGDVWKHVVWWALLERLHREDSPLDILDCHAGAGEYRLQSTGEWTAGIGALRSAAKTDAATVVAKYSAFIDQFGVDNSQLRRYPGSPRLLERLWRPGDRLACYELEPTAFGELNGAAFGSEVERINGDGLAALRARCAEPMKGRLVGLIDPPWNIKSDWHTIPLTMIECVAAAPSAVIAVWYPIKSYSRVNQMIRTLREGGLPSLIADVITTPLDIKRNRLNGSGVCIVNAPADLAPQLAEAGAVVGSACSSHRGFFEIRLNANP